MVSNNLPPPADDERRPYKDLTGQVTKSEEFYFAYGGFSEIYRGVWTESPGVERRVAIKILRGVHTDSRILEVTKRRLNRESRVWHLLNHPSILPFLGICNGVGPSPALISPLCDSGTALDYVNSHPETNRPLMIRRIAEGLAYLHQHNVIHGDLKSHNILIGDNGFPLLCDFGRSKLLDHRGFTTDFSGATRYMAPELLGDGTAETDTESDEPNSVPILTKKTDVYGFGMVGLEVLTGKVPFHSIRNETAVMHKVQTGKRPTRDKDISPSSEIIWTLLEDCWNHEPNLRPEMSAVIARIPVD